MATEPKKRTWYRGFLAVVIWLLVFEAIAWIIDWKVGFHYAITNALETAEEQAAPMRTFELPWPDDALRIRIPDQYGPRDEPYTLGGETIEDAWPDGKQRFVTNDELRAGSPRIVVIGGSAAFGYPYRYEDSFAVQLERELGGNAQVLNAGQIGWTSTQARAVARRALEEFDADIVIAFLGNNEWIHWTPSLATEEAQNRTSGLALQRTLAHSRAYAGLLYLVQRFRGADKTSEEEMPSEESPILEGYEWAFAHPRRNVDFAAWSRARTEFLDQFERNLEGIRRDCIEHETELVLMSMPFNHRLSIAWRGTQPDAFNAGTADEVRALTGEAHANMNAGDLVATEANLRRAIALDEEPPVVHAMLGHALELQGRHEEAEAAYERAREQVVGHLGARTSINRIIETAGRRSGVTYIDIRAHFDAEAHASGEYYNETLIEDDCHPTPRGHRLMARALAGQF